MVETRVHHKRLVHAIEMGQRSTCCCSNLLYVTLIFTYNQVLYLMQIMHVLITARSTSMCACVYTTAPKVSHSSASFDLKCVKKQENGLLHC